MDALATAIKMASVSVTDGSLDAYCVIIKSDGFLIKIIGFKNGIELPAPFWEQFN